MWRRPKVPPLQQLGSTVQLLGSALAFTCSLFETLLADRAPPCPGGRRRRNRSAVDPVCLGRS
jgi:hypothetical protein